MINFDKKVQGVGSRSEGRLDDLYYAVEGVGK